MKKRGHRARVNFTPDLHPRMCAELDKLRRDRGRLIEMYAEKWAQFRHLIEEPVEAAKGAQMLAAVSSGALRGTTASTEVRRQALVKALDEAGEFDVG